MAPAPLRRLAFRFAAALLLFGCATVTIWAADSAPTYKLPAGNDVEALMDFIQQLREFEPKTQQAYDEHVAKAPSAIQAAAEKILKLEKDPKSENAQKAAAILLELRVDTIASAPPEVQRATLQAVKQILSGPSLKGNDINLAMTLASNLEMSGKTELAAEAYETFGKQLAENSNERVVKVASRFLGAARRLSLVGKPLEISWHHDGRQEV